jgi:hypothetical protein
MPKTFQNVQAVLVQRTGPEMRSLWHWDATKGVWLESVSADDGFSKLCQSFQQQGCDYCFDAPHTAVGRERLLTLTAGKLARKSDWHKVRNMDSFMTEADARARRLTFTHEQVQASDEFRREHLRRYIKLQTTVLADPNNFPETIQDLRGDWQMQTPRESNGFRFNLASASGNSSGATAIFVGLEPPDRVQQLMDDLVRAWGKIETRRLAIWYEFQNSIRCMCLPLPSIVEDSEPPASIARSTTS